MVTVLSLPSDLPIYLLVNSGAWGHQTPVGIIRLEPATFRWAAAHLAGPLPSSALRPSYFDAPAKFTSVYRAEGFPVMIFLLFVFQIESFLGWGVIIVFFLSLNSRQCSCLTDCKSWVILGGKVARKKKFGCNPNSINDTLRAAMGNDRVCCVPFCSTGRHPALWTPGG